MLPLSDFQYFLAFFAAQHAQISVEDRRNTKKRLQQDSGKTKEQLINSTQLCLVFMMRNVFLVLQ
jgi:hypothetical protein